jgi:hypothetical protein
MPSQIITHIGSGFSYWTLLGGTTFSTGPDISAGLSLANRTADFVCAGKSV